MKSFLLILLSVLLFLNSFSQTDYDPESLLLTADSLIGNNDHEAIKLAKRVLTEFDENDAFFIKSAVTLGIAYKNIGQYDTSLYFANLGLEKALSIRDTVNLIKLYANRGVVHYLRASYLDAAEDFKTSSSFYVAYRFDTENDEITPLHLARVLNNVASAYIKTGQTDSALTYFIKSLEIREKNDAPARMLVVSKLNIGSIYLAMEDYKNGDEWMRSALEGSEKINDSALMAKCHTNMGIIGKKTGDTLSSIVHYKKGLAISEQIGNERDEAIALQNLAILYVSQKKWDDAYSYAQKALKKNNKIKANNAAVYLSLTNLFYERHMADSAIYNGNIALKLSLESGDVTTQTKIYNLLYDTYKLKGNTNEALRYYEYYTALKDSTLTKENMEFVENLKTKFETEKKEKEIEFLKKLNESESIKSKAIQSRQRLTIIFSLLGLILFTALFIFYRLKRKKEKALLLVEQKLLKIELEKEEIAGKKLQAEIVFKTKQLTTHALNMMQKNKLWTDISERIKESSKKLDDEMQMEFKSITREISRNQKADKDWELFRKYFETVKTGFNDKLREINPQMSTNDYRLAALISLNLNIKESAALLNITPDSVKLARHRLRKKLNLETGDDLYTFLSSL